MTKKRLISLRLFSPLFLEAAKKEADKQSLPLMVMFQDEARFGRISDSRYCWTPAGTRPDVKKQMVREYTYLYGAFCPLTGNADFLILPSMNTPSTNYFLKELSNRYPNNFICIFWDGAPCHSTTKLEIPSNIMLETLPPYSPELNPSENVWAEIREKFFHNIVFNSMKAVEERLIEAARYYEANPEVIKSIVGWEWITSSI